MPETLREKLLKLDYADCDGCYLDEKRCCNDHHLLCLKSVEVILGVFLAHAQVADEIITAMADLINLPQVKFFEKYPGCQSRDTDTFIAFLKTKYLSSRPTDGIEEFKPRSHSQPPKIGIETGGKE